MGIYLMESLQGVGKSKCNILGLYAMVDNLHIIILILRIALKEGEALTQGKIMNF